MMTEIKKEEKLVNSFQINFDTQCLPNVRIFSPCMMCVHYMGGGGGGEGGRGGGGSGEGSVQYIGGGSIH